nr:hypothetical protein [Tanacetum cinerariifolium]GEY51163.1 hypothetical protein [Tanacetum cinerariifolium]
MCLMNCECFVLKVLINEDWSRRRDAFVFGDKLKSISMAQCIILQAVTTQNHSINKEEDGIRLSPTIRETAEVVEQEVLKEKTDSYSKHEEENCSISLPTVAKETPQMDDQQIDKVDVYHVLWKGVAWRNGQASRLYEP